MIELYDYPLSGNCYKVRLLLALLGVEYRPVAVDFFPGKAHRGAEFGKLNPAGQLPVLRDGGLVLRDSGAILVYLARRYDDQATWYPVEDAAALGRITMWLAHAYSMTATASAARLHDMLNYPLDIEAARKGAHAAFRILDDHLHERRFDDQRWLVGQRPTVADIACFPYTALAGDGGISLDDYPAIRRWLLHVKSLPGFVTMPGIHPLFEPPPG
ncbi:MAG: glutathione S-transferase [Gammaproteobacteria bacterium]|nr:glutathione S-transferase [Gammaproteobacteria bacterium]